MNGPSWQQIAGAAIGFLLASLPIVLALVKMLGDVNKIKITINGRVTELIDATNRIADARIEDAKKQGNLEGRDAVRAEIVALKTADAVAMHKAKDVIAISAEQAKTILAVSAEQAKAVLTAAEQAKSVLAAAAEQAKSKLTPDPDV